ncbi:hypothetical protein Tsubulata_024340, partial [Turnera subulata]
LILVIIKIGRSQKRSYRLLPVSFFPPADHVTSDTLGIG